jgi:hypothetical protein
MAGHGERRARSGGCASVLLWVKDVKGARLGLVLLRTCMRTLQGSASPRDVVWVIMRRTAARSRHIQTHLLTPTADQLSCYGKECFFYYLFVFND